MMSGLPALQLKRQKTVVGLMSGTSLDGLDVAVVSIVGAGLESEWELLHFVTVPYPKELRGKIEQALQGGAEDVCRLNFDLGEAMANAVASALAETEITIDSVDLIGSPGQTIFHVDGHSTLQVGEAAVLAERFGTPVVADFRVSDIAAGGSGAPLVPYVDLILFRNPREGRLVLNLGGIANFTLLPPGAADVEEIAAWDTGPGVMVIDAVTRWLTNGRQAYDEEGRLAKEGTVSDGLLAKLLSHPFVHREPPKSTGREEFGSAFVEELLRQAHEDGVDGRDVLATVTAFTAHAVHLNYESFGAPTMPVDEVIVSGGGSWNRTLLDYLRDAFSPLPVRTTSEFGLPVDAKEALAFAILANEAVMGHPANVPQATGASQQVILGKYVPAPHA